MKSLTYFPFERNKYFFGKLLGVADFEAEQKYINNKRRLINRMLHGIGVVCGLKIIKVDDSFISVETGMALDNVGREIVIDKPIIKKLSMFDGFDQDKDPNDSRYVYLCLEYFEEEKEPIHSITNPLSNDDDNIQYNKFREKYRLYLDYEDPQNKPSESDNLYSNTYKIYEDNGVCIKHMCPKYVKETDKFIFKVLIEKNNLISDISLNYEIDLNCFAHNDEDIIAVNFDENEVVKSDKYEIEFEVKAKHVRNVDGEFIINPEKFKLKIGSNEVKLSEKKICNSRIIGINPKKQILDNYFSSNMDDIVNSNIDQKIYLAKIGLVKAANTYIIETVENNPFNQYVLGNLLLQTLQKIEIEELDFLKGSTLGNQSNENGALKRNDDIREALDTNTGIVSINIDFDNKSGDIFYSDEIIHSVGIGNVYSVLGIQNNEEIVFGSNDIFNNSIKAELACKMNVTNGTMVIGIKLLEHTDKSKVDVRWMVYRDSKERSKDLKKSTISIKPDICELNVRESIYLEAVSTGINDKRCEWTVKEKEGGHIDSNGKYVAPNIPGIYEIVAKSIENPELECSTFIVVRDDNK